MNSVDIEAGQGAPRQEFSSVFLILMLLVFLLFAYGAMSGPAMAISGSNDSFCGLTYNQVMFVYSPLISLAESVGQSERIDDYVNWCILTIGLGSPCCRHILRLILAFFSVFCFLIVRKIFPSIGKISSRGSHGQSVETLLL